MLSKTSFFNRTLFRKNLSRFWPLWGLASFVGVLLPASILLNMSYYNTEAHQLTELYYHTLVSVIPIVSLVYALLCALCCWEFLYAPRSVSMMHSLPLRREGVFATNFLSGMTMMAIPYAVTAVMCIIVSLMMGAFSLLPLLNTVLGVAGMSLFYFCSATCVAFLTGNLFMLPVLYFLLHFLAPLADFLAATYAGQFIYGINASYSGKLDVLSPTVFLMRNMDVTTVYETTVDPIYGMEQIRTVVGYQLHGLWMIGLYAIAGLALLGCAWLLYNRRHSECAGDVIAHRGGRPVFRFGIALLAALCGGLVLYMLLWESFRETTLMRPLPLTVCMIVAGAIGYYAASMLLAKSLRVFRGSWKGLAIVALCSATLCFSLSFDIFGIGRRIPAAAAIETLTFRAGGNTYYFEADDVENDAAEAALLEQVLDIHRAITADSRYIVSVLDERNAATTPYNAAYYEENAYTTIRFTYDLKDGTTVERRYNVILTRERMAKDGTYDAMLDELVNSTPMRAKRLLMDRPELVPYYGHIWMEFGDKRSFALSDRETVALTEAVRADALSGSWGNVNWFDGDRAAEYAMGIELNFEHEIDPNTYDHDYISVSVNPRMHNTIACLMELGIISGPEALKTVAEMDVENFKMSVRAKYGVDAATLSVGELERYCEELGYDFADMYLALHGGEAVEMTSFPTEVSSAGMTVTTVTVDDLNPNSSSLYIG